MNHAPVPSQYLPSRKSWFARNLAWFLPTIIILAIVLFAGAVMFLVFGLMRSSEPYQHAVQLAIHHPRVAKELGSPVATGWYATGSITVSDDSVSGSSGNADLKIPLQGSTRKGSLYVSAKKQYGTWSYDAIQVRIDGETDLVDLLNDPASQPREKR